MPAFKHQSLKSDGGILRGRIDAANENDAYAKLRDKGLHPFEIALVRETALPGLHRFRTKANAKAKARYIRQMATLLNAGMSLLDVMDSLARGGHPQLRTASDSIRKALRAGERLSDAIEKHLPGFPDYVARLAELGESTGALPKALSDAAKRMEQQEALRSEIRSALTYPAFLAVTGIVITLFMFFFVVPRFEALIGADHDSLPFLSRMVLSSSALVREHAALLGLGSLAAIFGVISLIRSPSARAQTRDLIDRAPVIGPFLRRTELANWSRTMGVAMKNGADLLTAFDLAARAMSSPLHIQGLKEARRAVRAGEPLDEAVDDALSLDRTFTDLIRTGRQAAALDDMLLFMSDILDEEARERAKKITALAEPIAILLIALVVGTLVLGIVLAMTSLYEFDF